MRRSLQTAAVMIGWLGVTIAVRAQELPDASHMQTELAGLYQTKQASPDVSHRGELCRQLETHLIKQGRFYISQMRPWKEDARAVLLTTGLHTEHGLRPNAHAASELAIIARFATDGYPKDFSPAIAKEKSIALLRYLVYTHGAGGKLCADGKPWKNQWQSAHWAACVGRALWLLWDDLPIDIRWLGARMICDEADRFLDRVPDHRVDKDTAAEENAWNAECITLAACMFPNHPRHAQYLETAQRWQISSFMRAKDSVSSDVVDGKPIKDWFAFANIHDDYTLENHDRVHPDYMCCTAFNLYDTLFYTWAGNPTPDTARFNTREIYDVQRWFMLPDGGWVYPNGQDWSLHRVSDWFSLHVAMAVMYNDAQAAAQARHCMKTMLAMTARQPDKGIYLPGENTFPSSEGLSGEWAAMAYLLMGQLGEGPAPVSDESLWKSLAGRRVFETGKFGILRTDHSVATFSWGQQALGQVYPLRDDLLCTPNERSMIGRIMLDDKKQDEPKVIDIKIMPDEKSLGICGILDRANGAVEQRFAYLALPDGRVIWVDQLTLKKDAPKSIDLGTIGILNDPNWPAHPSASRKLVWDKGEKTFEAKNAKTDDVLNIQSPWYNIDGMGILILNPDQKQQYNPKPSAAMGRLEQLFHLNHLEDTSKSVTTVNVFCPGQTPDQTRLQIQSSDATIARGKVTVRLDGRQEFIVDLDHLTVEPRTR